MKLGLAEQMPPFPPTVLVLGEGAVAQQIQTDLDALGLLTLSVADLKLSLEQRILPGAADIDAQSRLHLIFAAFRNQGPEHSWVHPGVTVWSERHEFEGWAMQSGINAICSPAKNLSLFWNQMNLLSFAAKLNIPTLALSDTPLTSVREIEEEIKVLTKQGVITNPLVLKSAFRMRGGYGNRVIHDLQELKEWVPLWMSQIESQTGNCILFIERYLESARCYAIPYVRFKSGESELFPCVDASLSVEGKNWVEVCPAQNLDVELEDRMRGYTKKLIDGSDYVGSGLLIFLTNGVEAYLIEGLARLNFSYPLWERVARTKALWWQVASLAPPLVSVRPQMRHALSAQAPICGINLKFLAEDTALKIPSPGEVHELSQETEWVRAELEADLVWDVRPGQMLNAQGSGALGQLTVFAPDWHAVLAGAREILNHIWISGGIQTNERFLQELLVHPWVQESMFYSGFVDEEFIPRQAPDPIWFQWIARALVEVAPALSPTESWLWMNHRLPDLNTVPPIHWSSRVEFITQQGMRGIKGYIQIGMQSQRICVFPISHQRIMVRIQNWFFSVRRSEKGRPLQLMALTSGRVHSIFYQEGSKVAAKQTVLILESLQRLISHKLPIDVTIKSLKVRAEDEVQLGDTLAELERSGDT